MHSHSYSLPKAVKGKQKFFDIKNERHGILVLYYKGRPAPPPNEQGWHVLPNGNRFRARGSVSTNPLHLAAIDYALQLGIPVFPCKPDRKPYTHHGFLDATTDPQQISDWWKKWPDALIGMPTGEKSGIAVVDLDVKNGKNGFAFVPDWESRSNVIARTQSGGAHLYYKHDGRVLSQSDQIAPGVDTRAKGGYVIVPPSTGYEFLKGDLSQRQDSAVA